MTKRRMKKRNRCPECGGAGKFIAEFAYGTFPIQCETCEGTGKAAPTTAPSLEDRAIKALAAVAWGQACDEFAAEDVREGTVEWVRKNNPYLEAK